MRRDLSIQPPRDVTLASLSAFTVQLNQRLDQLADLIYRIGELSGDILRLTGDLDLGGKRIMNVGATRADTDVPTRGELRKKSLYADVSGVLKTNRTITAGGGIAVPWAQNPAEVPQLAQIIDQINAMLTAVLSSAAPKKVATTGAAGTVAKASRDDHVHPASLNLDDAQVITGPKTFDLDPAAPFIVTAASAKVDNLDVDKLDGKEAAAFTLNQAVTYVISNVTTDRTYNADHTTLNELADVLGTLIVDLRSGGFLL